MLIASLLLACGDATARVDDARTLLAAGRYGEAVPTLRAVLAANPENAEAHHLLGLAYAQLGRPQLAAAALERARETEAWAVPAGLLLASLRLRSGEPDAAMQAASAVLARDAERHAARYTRAHAALELAQPAAALRDCDALLEERPHDLAALQLRARALAALGRVDDAEAAHDRIAAAASAWPRAAAEACLASTRFLRQVRGDDPRADARLDDCLAQHPAEPGVLRAATARLAARGETERATALWHEALNRNPRSLALRAGLAHRLVSEGREDESETLLRSAAEADARPESWQLVVAFERRRGRPGRALDALERASALLSAHTDAEPLRLLRADLLVDLGELEAAETLLRGLSHPAWRDHLRGRLALARGDAAAALEAFEASLAQGPGHAEGHAHAGRAAWQLGDLARASAHLREATRRAPQETDAALWLARVLLADGRPRAALAAARRHLALRPVVGPEAHLVLARAAATLQDQGTAEAALAEAERRGAPRALVVARRARLEHTRHGPESALALIEASGLALEAPEHAPLREIHFEALLATDPERATREARRLAAREPTFAALVGRVALRRGERERAREAFERLLRERPTSSVALTGLATLAALVGAYDEAFALYERALRVDPQNAEAAYHAARLQLERGEVADAERRLRALLRRHPGHGSACNDLAWLLAERGDADDEALALAERAVRRLDRAEAWDTLGWVQLQSGRAQAAIASFERALARQPDSPDLLYHLGLAQAEAGRDGQALATLRRALRSGEFRHAPAARAEAVRLSAEAE